MKLTAQRVVSAGEGVKLTGINAYFYSHGRGDWLNGPPPDLGDGELVNKHTQVPPGGNRVRSYLDIITPDSTHQSTIEYSVRAMARDLAERETPLPWTLVHADVYMEFNLEASLASHWQVEFETLLAHCLAVDDRA